MAETLRVAVGIMGNAASLLLYAAPILTFKRVIRKRSTEEFSCIPYIIALLNCLLYTWYGSPMVSRGWENFPLVTINGLGIILEASFISIYIWFATAVQKKHNTLFLVPVLLLFAMTATIATFSFNDHHHRKIFVGSVGVVASVSMYCSPLVVVRQVILTKSVEFMPFYLSLFSFIASSLWMAYGLLGKDFFIASPNFLGSPMGLLQLVLYCIYRKGRTPEKNLDVENNEVLKPVQPFYSEKITDNFKLELPIKAGNNSDSFNEAAHH